MRTCHLFALLVCNADANCEDANYIAHAICECCLPADMALVGRVALVLLLWDMPSSLWLLCSQSALSSWRFRTPGCL